MRQNFGAKPYVYPMPVLIVGTYAENGVPNAMNAAWGGQWDAKEIIISMGSHVTTQNLNRSGDFTVAFATKDTMVASDFVGIVSSKNDPQKMQKTGWTAIKAENDSHSSFFIRNFIQHRISGSHTRFRISCHFDFYRIKHTIFFNYQIYFIFT